MLQTFRANHYLLFKHYT